ncbi:MAG: hypothetical protein ABIQ10_02690 [Gemmatimonadaceae bacterium]
MERVMAARVESYNSTPQPELGGLSPDVVHQLLNGDWKRKGALRLNESLTFDELASSAMLADARTLLEYVAAEGPIKETAGGHLARTAVVALLPRLRLPVRPDGWPEEEAPINEGDVYWLPLLRHVLTFAGLFARRKGIRITPIGIELLQPEHAGRLYALLFRTFFQRLELGSLSSFGDHARLQSTLAFSFYKLRTDARTWATYESLAVESWLDSAKDPPSGFKEDAQDLLSFTFKHRVLDPLEHFALLESRVVPRDDDQFDDEVEYRCTPLFDRFLRFELVDSPEMPSVGPAKGDRFGGPSRHPSLEGGIKKIAVKTPKVREPSARSPVVSRPQADLLGLSPSTISELLHGDWRTEGALRLTESLTLDDLAGSALLADARTLLEFFEAEGPVKETVAKYLPRVAVAALIPRLRIMRNPRYAFEIEYRKPKNEADVPWLDELRGILIIAGLLARRKGVRITPRGRELLAEPRAGELFAHLFRTVFRELDLSTLTRWLDHPLLQQTVAVSFFKLRTEARDWTSAQSLSESSWLPSAKDPPKPYEVDPKSDLRYIALKLRVLVPLEHFGLLDAREQHGRERWDRWYEFRVTPLYDRFLTFRFRPPR